MICYSLKKCKTEVTGYLNKKNDIWYMNVLSSDLSGEISFLDIKIDAL